VGMRTLSIRRQAGYVAILVALAGGAIGCAGKAERAATQPSVRTEPAGRVIELGPQTLSFTPTRDDLTVGCAVLPVVSSHPVRVNGVEARQWNYLYLKQVGKNQFELPALRIEFAPDGPETIGCLSVKIWFNEVTNYTDSGLYEHRDDRYALVSWCTNPPELMKDTSYKARFGENRVQTLGEFKERLAKPFPLRMNQTPLRADWGYPMTKGYGRELSEAELKAVKQLMRDRGEQYLISIGGRDATHADVGASIGDMTRYQGVRHYQLALKQGVWQVESVVEEPNVARLADR
jgi:hypothetical protein